MTLQGVLAVVGYPEFDVETYRAGHLSPVVFGSGLKSISVPELLRSLGDWAPEPRPQPAEPRPILPSEPKVTGFVFKVQANMDANHRDRIAFLRLSSGTFKRGMKLRNVRSGKDLAVTNPMFFFGHDRELAEEAVAGDIVGIPNHGTLSVGDTLVEGTQALKVTGIPNFAPEIIRRVRLTDPIKAKQLSKALSDLAEEGVAQVFRRMIGADTVGVVAAATRSAAGAHPQGIQRADLARAVEFRDGALGGSGRQEGTRPVHFGRQGGACRGQGRRPGLPRAVGLVAAAHAEGLAEDPVLCDQRAGQGASRGDCISGELVLLRGTLPERRKCGTRVASTVRCCGGGSCVFRLSLFWSARR